MKWWVYEANPCWRLIDTQGKNIPNEPKITAELRVINRPEGNQVTDSPTDYSDLIGSEIRGQTSAYFDKKGYGIELRRTESADTNVSRLGLDKSLVRNALAH